MSQRPKFYERMARHRTITESLQKPDKGRVCRLRIPEAKQPSLTDYLSTFQDIIIGYLTNLPPRRTPQLFVKLWTSSYSNLIQISLSCRSTSYLLYCIHWDVESKSMPILWHAGEVRFVEGYLMFLLLHYNEFNQLLYVVGARTTLRNIYHEHR